MRNHWARWLVLVLLWGGLEAASAPDRVLTVVIVFALIWFLSDDVALLRKEASDLQNRIEALEGELGALRKRDARPVATVRPWGPVSQAE